MKFVLASQNRHKLEEMTEILRPLGVEIVLQSDLGVSVEVEESGETFEDNARLKAQAVMRATGLPAIADDSGLCVDALGGGPGVYSARYGGQISDSERVRLLLNNMHGAATRAAHFETAIVCAVPDGGEIVTHGRVEGSIAYAPAGEGGFGYDPVFFYPEARKTFAQMTGEEKAKISHRGKALRQFVASLREILNDFDTIY